MAYLYTSMDGDDPSAWLSISAEEDAIPHINQLQQELMVDADHNRASGTVFVAGAISIYSPIQLVGGLTLDFQNSLVTLRTNTSFLTAFGPCQHANIRNVRLRVLSDQSEPLIHLAPGLTESVEHCHFRYIHVESVGSAPPTWDLIVIEHYGGSTSHNHFEHIRVNECRTAILFEGHGSQPEGDRHNLFSNLMVRDGMETLVQFLYEGDEAKKPDMNVFHHVKGQYKAGLTVEGISNIQGEANHFAHVQILDWPESLRNQKVGEWHIGAGANRTYIVPHTINSLTDYGSNTLVLSDFLYPQFEFIGTGHFDGQWLPEPADIDPHF